MYLQKKYRKCKPEAKESGYVRGEGGRGMREKEGRREKWKPGHKNVGGATFLQA